MRIKIVIGGKRTFEFEGSQLKDGVMSSLSSHSWEGYSSFSIRYIAEEDVLLVEFWAEWPWLEIDGKEERLF